MGLLFHTILFFLALSFAVGTCDTFLNEDDLEIIEANAQPERESFTQLVEKSMSTLKVHCLIFCGPFVLVEVILCCVYYSEITKDC